jgi:hypothetical protein
VVTKWTAVARFHSTEKPSAVSCEKLMQDCQRRSSLWEKLQEGCLMSLLALAYDVCRKRLHGIPGAAWGKEWHGV